MFRVTHHISRLPDWHTLNMSARTGMRAAEKAKEMPYKYLSDPIPNTSSAKVKRQK